MISLLWRLNVQTGPTWPICRSSQNRRVPLTCMCRTLKLAGGLEPIAGIFLRWITQKLFWHNEMNVAMHIYKKIIPVCITAAILASCSNEPRRDPGRIYMPDMTYSRAYETYSETPEQREALLKKGIHYSNLPVAGTLKRGEMIPFDIPKDEGGDTAHYAASKAVKNPLTALD